MVFNMRSISISHSNQCFFYCETYIGISPYRTMCCGFHCRILVSTNIALYRVIFTISLYRYQPISHFVQWFSLLAVYLYQLISHSVLWLFTMRRISVSVNIALCTVVFNVRRISVSVYISLCVVVFTMGLCWYQPISHFAHCFFTVRLIYM